MSARIDDPEPVLVRYQADVWVQVAPDGEVLSAVVDSATIEVPIDVVWIDGSAVVGSERAAAVESAQSGLWPSWDFGSRPTWQSGVGR